MDHPQANLACFSADCPDHGGPIIVISPVTDLFISPATGGISRIRMIVTFFPRRSETFHPFQSGCHLKEFEVDVVGHSLGFLGGLGALFDG